MKVQQSKSCIKDFSVISISIPLYRDDCLVLVSLDKAFQHEALFASSTESGACLVYRHLGSSRVIRSLTLLICLTSQISLKKRHCGEIGR